MNSTPKLSKLSMRKTVFEFTCTPYPVKDMLVNLDHLPKTPGLKQVWNTTWVFTSRTTRHDFCDG